MFTKNYQMIKFFSSFLICIFLISSISAQTSDEIESFSNYLNTITTSAPFLIISPDARAGGMGDMGVATSPDPMSMHWNPAKYAFLEDDFGVSVCYTPWLKALIPDINLSYLSGYAKISDREAIALSLRYFSLGVINFTNSNSESLGSFNPNEFAISSAYATKLSDNFSTSIALRYIYSNLTGGIYTPETGQTEAGNSIAGDVSAFFNKETRFNPLGGESADIAIGLNISNIGSKISYTNEDEADFIPTNLRLGAAFNTVVDDYNRISLAFEINKLLVPTPPVYDEQLFLLDDDGNQILDDLGNPQTNPNYGEILAGRSPDVPVITGIFQSFGDAPGGFKEELKEIIWQAGMEYVHAEQFAVRGGYFHEADTKGGRQFFTLGAGLKYNVFGLDFSYLIPMRDKTDAGTTNPLANTIRFALTFDFGAVRTTVNPEG